MHAPKYTQNKPLNVQLTIVIEMSPSLLVFSLTSICDQRVYLLVQKKAGYPWGGAAWISLQNHGTSTMGGWQNPIPNPFRRRHFFFTTVYSKSGSCNPTLNLAAKEGKGFFSDFC